MCRSWNNLPYEILSGIFNYLPTKTQYVACQLTCKSWSEIAQEQLYHSITFDTPEKYATFMQAMKSSPKSPGVLVKRINFGVIDYKKWNPAAAFVNLATCCPNVQDIVAYNTSQEFWVHLKQVRQHDGLWQRVRLVPSLVDEADIEAYVKAAMAYKNTLESLVFNSTFQYEEAEDFYMTQYRIIVEHLDEFPQLKRLHLTSYTNKSIYELESYIDQCHLLEDVKFNPIRVEETLSLQHRQQQQQIFGRRSDEGEITNLITVNQLHSVKHFSGDRMMMTDWSIRYLMHKFPQLDTLMLNSIPDEESDTMVLQTLDMSDTTLSAFSQYLSSMSNYQVHGKFIGKDPALVMGTFIEATKPKDYKIEISYTINSEEEPGYYPFMKFYTCKIGASMSLKSPLLVSDENCNKLEVQYLLDLVNFTWPHMPIIASHCSALRELIFGAGSGLFLDRTEATNRAYNDGVYNCLNQILQKCTSLEHLILEDIDLFNRKLDKNSINTSITHLEIFIGTILWGGLDGLSRRLPSLKRLILNETNIQLPSFAQEFCAMNVSMPTSDLENITWKKISCEFDCTEQQKFFLHVREITGPDKSSSGEENDDVDENIQDDGEEYSVEKFYALGRSREVEKITRNEFSYYSSNDDKYLCLDVFCKSLKSFTIQYTADMDHTYILD